MEHDHYLGTYAFEATPYWPEFEIVKENDQWILNSSNSDWKMELAVSGGTLVAQEDDGDEFKLIYESSQKQYVMSIRTQVSTRTGVEKRTLVKIKTSPNDQLEKEYGVTAANLVQKVRDSEDWIHQVKSFQVKAKDKWVKTAEGIEHRKKELQARFPDADLNRKKFWNLEPESEGELQIVFDDSRFRTYKYTKEKSEILCIWNGREFVEYGNYFTHDQEYYGIRKDIPEFEDVLVQFMWPRSKQHVFWWTKEQMENWQDWYGRPEDFILVGKQDYRDTPCYVLESCPKDFRRVRHWFVGIRDHLRYGDLTYEEGQLSNEHWTGDYEEVKPGWWFPMTQGYHVFERDDNGNPFIATTRNIVIEDVRVDETLPDELFVMEFKDGVEVNDDRFGGFVVYKSKKDRTDQEWEEIRQKALEREESDNAEKLAMDERIGQIAPEFPKECQWVNTEPLTLKQLRGKAVILQFWGIWCGPCHNYMGTLTAKTDNQKIVVIGIHTPEDDLDKIKADMDKYKADGPVCVDVGKGWGKISAWCRTKRLPYWIVIGPGGKVVGHTGDLSQAFQLAQKSVETVDQGK